MLRTLTALPPRPARFPPERGWACNDVSCYMPVGLSLRTEARCRLLLHTPNQPAYPPLIPPLEYIDNLYTNSSITALCCCSLTPVDERRP